MASNLTCPVPSNINPVASSGFMFSIKKIPEVSFFCQEVNIPAITLPSIDYQTPLSVISVAGDVLQFDDLVIQFIVDENMANYKAIVDWMIGLGFPSNHTQYKTFIDQQPEYNRISKESSSATLQVLGSNNAPVKTINFIDIIPTSIGAISFESTVTDVNYIMGTAVFKISRYEFID